MNQSAKQTPADKLRLFCYAILVLLSPFASIPNSYLLFIVTEKNAFIPISKGDRVQKVDIPIYVCVDYHPECNTCPYGDVCNGDVSDELSNMEVY